MKENIRDVQEHSVPKLDRLYPTERELEEYRKLRDKLKLGDIRSAQSRRDPDAQERDMKSVN